MESVSHSSNTIVLKMKRLASSTNSATPRKAMGVHYTPPLLAGFVADRLAREIRRSSEGRLRILDPACGDGALLEALLRSMKNAQTLRNCEVVGVEADKQALSYAQSRLDNFQRVRSRLIPGDFLDLATRGRGQADLWEINLQAPGFEHPFDIVIANPPYVRTQILGAEKSQRLAARFGLSGRVDLYHAFLVAATETLRPGGLMGIITSNRFLSTLGGRAVRGYLAQQYEIKEVIDLGDTKIFEAAVLPAIFIGRRLKENSLRRTRRPARFIKIYSQANRTNDGSPDPLPTGDIFDALRRGKSGCYRVRHGVFKLTRGELVLGQDPSQVWFLATAEETRWLDRVRGASHGSFADIAAVCVGIKTTADDVFIRSDWDTLPNKIRPEPDLLRPLLRHEDARRWVLPKGIEPAARILYPHEVSGGCRRAVDLRRYPRAKAYLESHKERLERRYYVIEARRQWYEIWVPQDPGGWAAPKIVFPDISPNPRFYLDLDGRLVNGDCYWITPRPGGPPDIIYLLLAVANSRLMSSFHDLAFNNRLYSARRRYITQYVAKYPYPDPSSPVSERLISLAKQIVEEASCTQAGPPDGQINIQLDSLVEEAFGFRSGKMAP